MLWKDLNCEIASLYQGGTLPTMVYINKQRDTRSSVRRPMHRHDSICEMLLIYKGEGIYYVGDESYPLEEGSLIYYNQGDLHEVKSAGDTEIGSYCIGITNLRRKGLERNYLIEPGGVYVRQSRGRYPILKSMCQQIEVRKEKYVACGVCEYH